MEVKTFWEFFENLDECVYVTDMDTYEIVYANKKTRDELSTLNPDGLIGKKCYRAIQNCSTPCAMCNNSELEPGKFKEWWYYNPVMDTHFTIKDTMVEENGKRYRIEFAINTSKINAPQSHEEVQDILTGEALRIALRKQTPDDSLHVVLEYLGKVLKSDRAYIFEKNSSGSDDNTYEWVKNGVVPQKNNLQNLPEHICKIWYDLFKIDKSVIIKDVEEVRATHIELYELLKQQDIHSLVATGLYDGKKMIGFLGIDNPALSKMDAAASVLQTLAYYTVATIKSRNMIAKIREDQFKQNKTLTARAQENLDMLNEIIGSGMWYIDFNEQGDMNHVVWSPTFRSMLGFNDTIDFPDALDSWADLIHEEDKDATLKSFWNAITNNVEFDAKYRLKKKDGEYNWFHSHGKTAHYEDGKTRLIVGTFINITKERLERQALEDAYHAANRANDSKTEFLANMSHDIRTPLNAIIGMTAIAGANIDNPEKIKHCLTQITTSSKLLLSLINEVLDMNKIESGKINLNAEEFSLANLIEDFSAITKPLIANKKHEFIMNVHGIKHENVIGDCERLQQCLMNFISNAVKYTPPGGKISFSMTEKPSGLAQVGCYEFVFEDNGIGIAPEFIEHLFDPFARSTDERAMKQQGTGLGLAIARNIIQMMNGDVKVESTLNKGSKFTATIFLKLQHDSEEALEKLRDLTTLVVDDEQSACESTCIFLNELGMQSEWVLTGQEAIEKTVLHHQNKDDYFAIIMDWQMPGMDGIETTKRIRELVGDEIPIIIFSAFDYTEIEDKAKEVGVNAFISKPIFKSRLSLLLKEFTSKESSQENTEALNSFEQNLLKNKRVLLVEDNELNAEIASEILQMTGLEIEKASDGLQALQTLEKALPGHFDLVLMDIQMPVMNGYEATEAIRKNVRKDLQQIPIVAMSANAFAEDIQKSITSGMNDHLPKPLDFERLLSILQKYL